MLLLLNDRLALVIEDTLVSKDSDDEDPDQEESNISDHPTPAVIRIASQAAVLFINKYLDLMWNCDIYIIAIGKQSFSDFYAQVLNIYFSYVPWSQVGMVPKRIQVQCSGSQEAQDHCYEGLEIIWARKGTTGVTAIKEETNMWRETGMYISWTIQK